MASATPILLERKAPVLPGRDARPTYPRTRSEEPGSAGEAVAAGGGAQVEGLVEHAGLDAAQHDLLPALEQLRRSLGAKAEELADVVKPGRTHLMDAVPVTLGQEFSGYAAQIRLGAERGDLPGILRVALCEGEVVYDRSG